jgi:hypothetical protein
MLAHGDAEEDEVPAPGRSATSEAAETGHGGSPERHRRRGGTIPDKRQARFTF